MKKYWNKQIISFVIVFIVIISFFPAAAWALTLTYVDRGISAPRHGAYAGLYNLTMDGAPVMGMCDDYTTHMSSTWEASLYTYEDINDGTQKGKFNNGGVDYKLYNKVAYAFSQTFGETDPNRLADINAVVWKIMYQALDISGWSTYASNLYAAANMHDDYNWSGKMYVLTPDPLNASQEILVQAPVPEPATLLLLGTGLIGLAGFGRRKFKK